MSTSGLFHQILLGHSWLWATKTAEIGSADKGGDYCKTNLFDYVIVDKTWEIKPELLEIILEYYIL